MFIGKAAKLSGASERAIRLYEDIGLLSIKRKGSYRIYSDDDLEFIKIIKEAQTLGIKLEELKALKNEKNNLDWTSVLDILEKKSQQAQLQIQQLHKYITRLEQYHQMIEQCLERP